jgi:hypothetical protein
MSASLTLAAPDGAAVLHEVRAFIGRFVAMPSPAALDLAALWAAHTHCTGTDGKLLFDSTPRLAFLSDLPGSGKSRALEMTASVARKAVPLADVTGPAMHSLISEGSTLMIDELDLILGSGDSAKPVRAALNAGYRRSGTVARSKGTASVFAPVALAGLAVTFSRNPLLAPTRSRAIVITMAPNAGRQQLDRWRERMHRDTADQLGAALGAWARGAAVQMVTTYPDLPDSMTDRTMDLWEPLLTVAAVAGGDWPERALAIWEELGTATGSTDPAVPPGLQLLRDALAIWPDGAARLSTADLVAAVLEMPGSVWPAVWRDAAQIPAELAAALRPYDVAPERHRVVPGGPPVQSYSRAALAAALAAVQGVQGVQGAAALAAVQGVQGVQGAAA